ncbi:uncharacterized protein At4g38062 isoform X2 [Brachypodium distachyon]|uniref:Uncharacterized protein n=2 Tax=Brachypodium distachyon TaxID=15368 RepID=I1GPF7_BRADI|nr:uncharacterized protein At4g38062 isoform X2 [Brachypodium distachyon]KQK13725.1 hypothetical protein BRADI_1g12067v3 [Brachypodium distachyon]|eukprot:XP_024312366.1 uncharacterized protein At4g38062 isoform X2 [Brachypodium distachyon]
MEEMSKELDELRSEVEARTAECRAKSALVDGLRRESAEQAARLREARAEIERQAGEIAAKDEEASSARELCEQLRAKFADKEQALRHLCAAHDGLKASLRERTECWDTEKRDLVAALEESEVKRQEQDVAVRSCNEEIARLRKLLSEKEKKCSEADQRALAHREVMVRDDTLAKLEEEKASIQIKFKWKTEQFRHLEDALKKVQDEFSAAKREWGSDRSALVDQIDTLETNLDSKTRVADEFRSRLEMCSQALAHEEGRRKLLEAEMSDLRHMYGNVVSEYEEARSTIELLTSKRDGEIASLRSSLAEKVTLLNEMEYCKARLDQENEELRSSLKEYQECQISGADAVVSLKGLWEKFRALEQTHRSCTEKLRDKEAEWKMQMGKLGNDLDGFLSQLDSKDMLIRQLQNELMSSYSLLDLQIVENWEASIVRLSLESKLYDCWSCIDTLELNMQQRCEKFEQSVAVARKQLEEKNFVISQSQAEQAHQLEVIATLRGRIEQLEYLEREHEKMQKQLGAYKEMLDDASRNVHCLKGDTLEKENSLQEKLGKALSDLDKAHHDLAEQKNQLSQFEINLHQQKQLVDHLEKLKLDLETELQGYKDDNHVLKRDLDVALNGKTDSEVSLIDEKEKLLGALSEAKCALSERKSELSENEIILHQQKQAVENLEKLRIDMEIDLKGYVDENHILKRDLDVALIAKMEAQEFHREEKQKLLLTVDEANGAISEMKKEVDQLKANIHQQKQAVEHLEKLKVDMQTELKDYKDENHALKSNLDVLLMTKVEDEDTLREERDKLSSIIDERDRNIDDLQQYINVLEEDNLGKKLDVASLIKLEVEKSIREVNNRYSEIVEVFDKKLLELETRLGFFEQKYTCREHEIMEIFDQEEADWYTLIAEKENAIADIQLIVESVQLNIKHLLEAAASKLTEVQLDVKQLYGFAENLNSLNLIQEHDNFFKDMLIAECERELEGMQLKLVEEKEQSGNLKHVLDKVKAETTAEMLKKAKEHLEVVNKLKCLEETKEMLEEHLGELKSRTKDMCNVAVQEKKGLVDELNGITFSIEAANHGDENLMISLRRIMQKVNIEEPLLNASSKGMPSLEKPNTRNHVPLTRNKSVTLPDRRLPLKENNY